MVYWQEALKISMAIHFRLKLWCWIIILIYGRKHKLNIVQIKDMKSSCLVSKDLDFLGVHLSSCDISGNKEAVGLWAHHPMWQKYTFPFSVGVTKGRFVLRPFTVMLSHWSQSSWKGCTLTRQSLKGAIKMTREVTERPLHALKVLRMSALYSIFALL